MQNAQRGFSLVEMMVGMTVGMIVLLAALLNYSSFEKQKRTTANISDAQINGLIAIHALQSETRMAGLGLSTPAGLACSQMNWYYNGQTGTSPIAPVIITDGGVSNSDSITFTYSDSPNAGSPSMLTSNAPNSDALITVKSVNSTSFLINHDIMLLASPSSRLGATIPCTRIAFVDKTINTPPPGTLALLNPPLGQNIFPVGGYNGYADYSLNMGNFVQRKYSVLNGNLLMTDMSIPGNPLQQLSSGIVSIRAQYGLSPLNVTPGTPAAPISCWTSATGGGCQPSSGDWAHPDSADISRIKAVRMAVISRSALMEKPGKNGCQTTATAPITWPGGPQIDLSADPNWQCYRYRVYQTITAMRNVIWSNM